MSGSAYLHYHSFFIFTVYLFLTSVLLSTSVSQISDPTPLYENQNSYVNADDDLHGILYWQAIEERYCFL